MASLLYDMLRVCIPLDAVSWVLRWAALHRLPSHACALPCEGPRATSTASVFPGLFSVPLSGGGQHSTLPAYIPLINSLGSTAEHRGRHGCAPVLAQCSPHTRTRHHSCSNNDVRTVPSRARSARDATGKKKYTISLNILCLGTQGIACTCDGGLKPGGTPTLLCVFCAAVF